MLLYLLVYHEAVKFGHYSGSLQSGGYEPSTLKRTVRPYRIIHHPLPVSYGCPYHTRNARKKKKWTMLLCWILDLRTTSGRCSIHTPIGSIYFTFHRGFHRFSLNFDGCSPVRSINRPRKPRARKHHKIAYRQSSYCALTAQEIDNRDRVACAAGVWTPWAPTEAFLSFPFHTIGGLDATS